MSVQAKCNLVELGSGLNESYIKILERKQEADPELQHLHLSMSDNSESNRFLYQHRTVIKMFAISILVFTSKITLQQREHAHARRNGMRLSLLVPMLLGML